MATIRLMEARKTGRIPPCRQSVAYFKKVDAHRQSIRDGVGVRLQREGQASLAGRDFLEPPQSLLQEPLESWTGPSLARTTGDPRLRTRRSFEVLENESVPPIGSYSTVSNLVPPTNGARAGLCRAGRGDVAGKRAAE